MKLGLLAAAPFGLLAMACGNIVIPAADDAGDSVADAGAAPLVARDASRDVADGPEPPALVLLEVDATPPQTSENGAITLRALVSDPRVPMADLATEITDETGASYGPLATNGSFWLTRTLTWSDIDRVRPIVTTGGLGTRELTVTVRAAGEAAARTVAVTLVCPVDRPVACAGRCAASCP